MENDSNKDGNQIIIIVENGSLSTGELNKLIQCIREIEQHDKDRIINILLDTPDKTIEEMKSLISSVKPGFPYMTIIKNQDH